VTRILVKSLDDTEHEVVEVQLTDEKSRYGIILSATEATELASALTDVVDTGQKCVVPTDD
jgi:hypothetical protein